MGRPFTEFPPGAREHLERMAENGMLSELAAATALGMPLEQLKHVIANHEGSRKIWQDSLTIERDKILGALWNRVADDGDTRAAQALLVVYDASASPKGPQAASQAA